MKENYMLTGCTETAKAIPQMIKNLQTKQLEIVCLSELLNIPAYRT